MGVCRQFLWLASASLAILAIGVAVMLSAEFDGNVCKLDTDIETVMKCMDGLFTYIWKEIHRTKDCVAAMYHHRIPDIEMHLMRCKRYEISLNETHKDLLTISLSDLCFAKLQDFVFNVLYTVRQLEVCLTSMIGPVEPESSSRFSSAMVSGPQCVRGLQERMLYFVKDLACLGFRTVCKRLSNRIHLMEILFHFPLVLALSVTIWRTLKRLALRTRWPVIALVLVVLVVFVLCHFRYRTEIGNNLFSIVFSPETLSQTFLKRIVVVNLDEHIGRNLTDWDTPSYPNKIARRYPGEDVVLYCGVLFFFNTKTKPTDRDMEVEWFHNHRRLKLAMKYPLIYHRIDIQSNKGSLYATIVVNNLTTNDFGSYKCDLSNRSKMFLTYHNNLTIPSEVLPISPKEITLIVPPGAMIKVRYSFFYYPLHLGDLIDFYGLVQNDSEKLKLDQSGKTCSIWTMAQEQLYRLFQSKRVTHSSDGSNQALVSFCVPFGYSRKHEFVSERLVQTKWETLIHPVRLIVKNPCIKDHYHKESTSARRDYPDFKAAATNVIDVLLIVVLSLLMDIAHTVLTCVSLFMLKHVLKRVVPYLAVRFQKQEWWRQKIYIACSERDLPWTKRNLVEFLESLGHETFIYTRDSLPTEYEVRGYSRGVEACHKYVMVVSRHFLGEEQWTFERSLIVEELRRRQCCPDGEHPTCLLFVCVGAAEVPGPRLGGSVLHAPQARRRGDLRCQVRSWLEDTVFHEGEWSTWYLLGVSCLAAISRSHILLQILNRSRIWENWSVVEKYMSFEEA